MKTHQRTSRTHEHSSIEKGQKRRKMEKKKEKEKEIKKERERERDKERERKRGRYSEGHVWLSLSCVKAAEVRARAGCDPCAPAGFRVPSASIPPSALHTCPLRPTPSVFEFPVDTLFQGMQYPDPAHSVEGGGEESKRWNTCAHMLGIFVQCRRRNRFLDFCRVAERNPIFGFFVELRNSNKKKKEKFRS